MERTHNDKSVMEAPEIPHPDDRPPNLIHLISILNQLQSSNRKHKLLFSRKTLQLNSMSRLIVKSPRTIQSNNSYEEHLVENTRLKAKCDTIEMNIRNERAKVTELQDRLRLYESNVCEAKNISQRLARDCVQLQMTQKQVMREMEESKKKSDFKICKLRTLKTGAQQYRTRHYKKTETQSDDNSKINHTQNTSRLLPTDTNEQLQPVLTKGQVKCMLKCMYVLNALIKRIPTSQEFIGKERSRMLSKNQIIDYFQRQHFQIHKRFQQIVLSNYRELKVRLKELEVEFQLKQELVDEKRQKLSHLEEEIKNNCVAKTILEEIKMREQLLKQMNQQHTTRQNQIVKYAQFHHQFTGRMFRIYQAIRSVAGSFYPSQQADTQMQTLLQTWKQDKSTNICQGQQDRLQKSWIFKDSIWKPDRITHLYIHRQQTHQTDSLELLTEQAYKHMDLVVCSLTRTFKRLVSILKRLTAKYRRETAPARIDYFRDSYCIESPEFYCRDNMKLLEKLEAIKMRNMGTRKLIPADMEINLEGPLKDRPYALRKKFPQQGAQLSLTFASLSQRTAQPQSLVAPFTNLHTQRRRLQQSQNMSVRNIVSMIKKIGILSGTGRKRQRSSKPQ